MEALVLILAIAVIVGFIIFKSTSEEALEVLDKAKNEKPAVATKAVAKPTKAVKKPQPAKPVKAAVTKKTTATKTTNTRKKKV